MCAKVYFTSATINSSIEYRKITSFELIKISAFVCIGGGLSNMLELIEVYVDMCFIASPNV